MRRLSLIIWKARIFGFACGASMAIGTGLLAQSLPPAPHETRAGIEDLIIPALLAMVGVVGWFSRDAYNRISARLDRMEQSIHSLDALGGRVERIDKDLADLSKILAAVQQWQDFRQEWREFHRATVEWRQSVERRIDSIRDKDDGR